MDLDRKILHLDKRTSFVPAKSVVLMPLDGVKVAYGDGSIQWLAVGI